MNDTPIKAAIAALGGPVPAAKALTVTPGMVHHWINGRNDVAPAHCPTLERLTGVKCEALRPDLEWTRKRGKVVGYQVRLQPAA